MEEVAGVEQSEKLTGTQVYAIIQKEILANALPSRLVKRAPRMLVGLISMLDDLVVSESASWGTLRFDDHRGVNPLEVSFVGGSLSARLMRSKTLGSDRSVGSRQIFIYASCFIARREWRVLCKAADFDRDHLLPSPTTNCNGCLPSELRYDTLCKTVCCILYERKGTPCLQGSPRRSGLRIRLAHFCRAARRLLVCPRKNWIIWVDGARAEAIRTRVSQSA